MSKNIDELRTEIDAIDKKMVDLLTARIEVVKEIGRYKKENNISIGAPVRELTKIKDLFESIKDPYAAKYMVKISQYIFEVSKEIQQDIFNGEK